MRKIKRRAAPILRSFIRWLDRKLVKYYWTCERWETTDAPRGTTVADYCEQHLDTIFNIKVPL